MKTLKQLGAVLLSLSLLFIFVPRTNAQINSTGSTTFSGMQSESFSITVPPTGTLTFDGHGGASTNTITVTANWTAAAGRIGVGVLSSVTAVTGGLNQAATETVNGSATDVCNLTPSGLDSAFSPTGSWPAPGGPGAIAQPNFNCSWTQYSSAPAGVNQSASATYSYSTTGVTAVQSYSITVLYSGFLY